MAAPTKTSRLILALGILTVCTTLDQWTKQLADEHLKPDNWPYQHDAPLSYMGDTIRIQYATNEGAFLGWGSDWSDQTRFIVLTVTTGLFILALGVYILVQWKMELAKYWGVQLIFAGGLGNLVDRTLYDGKVIDFMNMGLGSLRTGIFNVADIAITAGALLLLLLSFRKQPPEPASTKAATSQ